MPRLTVKRSSRRPSDYRHASIASGRVITALVGVLAALVVVVLLSTYLDPMVTRVLAVVVVLAGIAAVVFEAERDDPAEPDDL